MIGWSINIERNNGPVDMDAVQQALAQAGIEVEEIDRDMEKIMVGQYSVGKAVKVINKLGYETDED